MIIVILQAGLANQMFQYAAGRQLALLRGAQLQLDTSWYGRAAQDDGVGLRHYELDALAIDENIYRPNVFNRGILKVLGRGIYSDDNEPYVFHEEVLGLPNYSRLFGFFQNRHYFESIRELLLKEFTPKDAATGANKQLLATIDADENSVAVHVRRGDYVTSAANWAAHGPLSEEAPEYYQQALAKIRATIKRPSLYVFSDDPAWCKANLKFDTPTVFVDNNNPGIEDLRLMRACQHNVIANSSFSWWGAWLNENPNKIVIAPKKWMHTEFDTSDVVPPEWVQV
jgi:hypothetical protein